ncbi:MAG: diphthine synthase [Candidatus Altiarchaeales archaeon ex4484_2]|nr:MAG: diphthine synthase [Candidatus Altiarchaeales archaeon ex4484_2]
MLYLIGLGIHDEGDVSIKAIETLKKVNVVYAELYTSFFNGDLSVIEKWAGKKINVLGRYDLEEDIDGNVLSNPHKDVALLVCGDPLIATTHADVILRARKKGVEVKIIHSSSIYSAVAETGLQIYKFGKTTTLPFPQGDYFPTSPYDVIKNNHDLGLHSLVLLDVKSEETRFMTVNEGLRLLLRMEDEKKKRLIVDDLSLVGIARLGGDSLIRVGTLEELLDLDFGRPPHSLVVPGELHFTEKDMLDMFRLD